MLARRPPPVAGPMVNCPRTIVPAKPVKLVGAAGVIYVELVGPRAAFGSQYQHQPSRDGSRFRGATQAASTGVLGRIRGTGRCWRTFGRAIHQRDCMTDIGSFRAVPVNLS